MSAAGQLLDLARMVVSVGGTGTLTLSGSAPGYLTFTQAGSADGTVYSYGIIDGSASEVGSATVGGSGTTLSSRTVDKSTNSNAAINVSVGAQVFICARRENLLSFAESMTWLTATEQAQGRVNLYAAPFDALAFNGMQVNGSMEVSQENGTTLSGGITNSSPYALDGVKAVALGATQVIKYQQVADAPSGLKNSLKLTVTTANAAPAAGDAVGIEFLIEGVRTERLAFGTASAQSLTIGFWVKAHRTGTYSGAIGNSATDRSYPFSFAVSASDTWEFKTVTLTGDTSGTWLTDTGIGLTVFFAMMAGTTYTAAANTWASSVKLGVTGTTNGVAATSDTFQITGVIVLPGIEVPSSAGSALIMRPFSDEIPLCRRYYEKAGMEAVGQCKSSSTVSFAGKGQPKRIVPTFGTTTTTPIGIEFAVSLRSASGFAVSSTHTSANGGYNNDSSGWSSLTAGNLFGFLDDYFILDARL